MSQPSQDAMAQPRTILDVLIVGGGLSGLYVGHGLSRRQSGSATAVRWKLLEASQRLGGRLFNASGTDIDMGGAWIWPEHQPHVKELTHELGLAAFQQPDDSSSTRIEGGAVEFIEKLSQPFLESDNTCGGPGGENGEHEKRIHMNSPVTACKLLKKEENDDSSPRVVVQVETANGETYLSRKVVFAVPPKLLSESVTFDPPLSQSKQAAMSSSRTWMAGVTKVALVYPQRFWDLGRSSSNMGFPSGIGPAFQVYDSSTRDNTTTALTFFAHVPPDSPAAQIDNDALLAQQVAHQMATVWRDYLNLPEYAAQAHTYDRFHVHRWPAEAYISGSDTRPDRIHPHPMPVPALSAPEWNGVLLFAGTETDRSSPGVMEGAIGAAKRVLQSLLPMT